MDGFSLWFRMLSERSGHPVSTLYQDKGNSISDGRKQCPSQRKASRKNASMTIGPGNSSSLFRSTLLPLAPSIRRSAAGTQKTELMCTDYPSHFPSSKLLGPSRDSSWLKDWGWNGLHKMWVPACFGGLLNRVWPAFHLVYDFEIKFNFGF